jgi:hypothetical protein
MPVMMKYVLNIDKQGAMVYLNDLLTGGCY